MSNFLSRIGAVSAWTLISRVLGLARDMLTSAVFGITVWNSAYTIAFMLPNLFRRLLGEGALTSALMPNLAEAEKSGGREAVHRLVNQTLSWLLLVCLSLTILATCSGLMLQHVFESGKWILVARLGVLFFPYLILVCLAAVMAAALNLFKRFAVPAMTAVWLNGAILIGLGFFGVQYSETLEGRMMYLCGATLLGGTLQLLAPAWVLKREGWNPRFSLYVSEEIRSVVMLVLPGILGAAVYQINMVVVRTLAYYHSDAGAVLVYYANRLVELPVGVFAIAIATVVFPTLAQAGARNDLKGFVDSYRNGALWVVMMAIPSAIGLVVLGRDIIGALFQRGLFDAVATESLVPILWTLAIGLPFFSFITVETRAFYSMKDVKTPVRIGIISMSVNAVAAVILLRIGGLVGLAMASNIAVILQAILLHVALQRRFPDVDLNGVWVEIAKTLLAAMAMGIGVYFGARLMQGITGDESMGRILRLIVLIPCGAVLYFVLLRLMGMRIARELFKLKRV